MDDITLPEEIAVRRAVSRRVRELRTLRSILRIVTRHRSTVDAAERARAIRDLVSQARARGLDLRTGASLQEDSDDA